MCGGGLHIRVLHQPVRAEDARREDGAAGLGGAVGGADDGEDYAAGAADCSEEGLGAVC